MRRSAVALVVALAFAVEVSSEALGAPPVRPGKRKTEIVEVVEKVSPAVVFIGTKKIVEQGFRHPDPFFDQFFDDFFGPRAREAESLGSGVIVESNGTIVTNEHVIRGASEVHVVLADGRKLDADVVGSDQDNDLAVLRVKASGALPAAKLGGSSDLMIGETVIAIGAPFGLQKTVTAGVVSATGRSFRAGDRVYNDFVQTDASINPGNSGGPLLNVDGEVVGINTAIYAGGQGIGFAIPADKVKRIVSELTRFGKVRPAYVGLHVQDLTPQLAEAFEWDRNYGVVVTDVEEGSPAARAGLARGDLIAEVGGTPVGDDEDFEARMRSYPAKTDVSLVIVRGGKQEAHALTTVEFPAALAEKLAWDRLGFEVKRSAQGALVVSGVRPRSPAARANLAVGDLLLRANNEPVDSPEKLRDVLVSAHGSGSVLLLVRRGRVVAHLTLPFQRG